MVQGCCPTLRDRDSSFKLTWCTILWSYRLAETFEGQNFRVSVLNENFAEKTFANRHRYAKFAKVFSREINPLNYFCYRRCSIRSLAPAPLHLATCRSRLAVPHHATTRFTCVMATITSFFKCVTITVGPGGVTCISFLHS